MKVIKNGNTYEIYPDTLELKDELPVQTYVVRFHQLKGFYLEKYCNIEIKEEKIYGVHENKVDKVLRNFKKFNRNLGVILSGDKGIGKSLFAKLLSQKAMAAGYPLIVVDTFYPGIASYIEEIEQEVVVLFDEFDKTFGEIKVDVNESTPQSSLLTLFDGIAAGKKLFVITCNEIHKLNDYLVNRPGRFHYHFRFDYPSVDEIREYLKDKLNEKFYNEIEKVVSFSRKINLNYDCLRAIAFELNEGEPFETAILDLNIVNTNAERYDVVIRYTNGHIVSASNVVIDLFDATFTETLEIYDKKETYVGEVSFNVSDAVFDPFKNAITIDKSKITIDYYNYNTEKPNEYENLEIDCLMILKPASKKFHYTV